MVKQTLARRVPSAYVQGMTALRHTLLRHRRWALIALALAFALRALIPQGMMAAPDTAHGITVLLCDGTGTAARTAIPLGDKPAKALLAQSCPFAVLAQAASADAPDGWNLAAPTPDPIPHGVAPGRTERRQHHIFLPPARAPPATA